jgi:catechol 2,3-dioxygenase-like lactoylglutathione lyase family enzyme
MRDGANAIALRLRICHSGIVAIRPIRAHHTALCVADAKRAEEFLTRVLGLVEVPRHDIPGARAWAASDEGFQIHLAQASEMPADGPGLVPHVALEVADLEEAREALRAAGLEFIDFRQVLFVADPDGNLFELRTATTKLDAGDFRRSRAAGEAKP